MNMLTAQPRWRAVYSVEGAEHAIEFRDILLWAHSTVYTQPMIYGLVVDSDGLIKHAEGESFAGYIEPDDDENRLLADAGKLVAAWWRKKGETNAKE